MQEGIIISHVSGIYQVESKEIIYTCTARGRIKKEEDSLATGDIVNIEITQESKKIAIIQEKKLRTSYIKRPKIANITQILLVVSMNMPKPDLLLLDKQLAYAHYLGIKPIICLNKVDLETTQTVEKIEKIYTDIGYTVLKINAKVKEEIKKLLPYLKNNITVCSGNSGVGKSTIINAIFGGDKTQEGDISSKNKKGKNTTTIATLYKLDSDAYIADTPGFSTLEISEISSNDLGYQFIEFESYTKKCEFIGCQHIKERICGVKQAVENEQIDKGRYERYCKIVEELKQKEKKRW